MEAVSLDDDFKRRTIALFSTMLTIGIFMSILSPFGMDKLPILGRFAYWIGLSLAGFMTMLTVDVILLMRQLSLKLGARVILHGVMVTVVLTAILTLVHRMSAPNAILITAFYVGVISFAAVGLREILDMKKQERLIVVDSQTRTSGQTPAIMSRLPFKFRQAELYALSGEDHYVRVHTSNGETLILMRLGDAIQETSPLEGITTHRSWWVATSGVETISKSGRAVNLVLKSGSQALVSRAGTALVKEAGWL